MPWITKQQFPQKTSLTFARHTGCFTVPQIVWSWSPLHVICMFIRPFCLYFVCWMTVNVNYILDTENNEKFFDTIHHKKLWRVMRKCVKKATCPFIFDYKNLWELRERRLCTIMGWTRGIIHGFILEVKLL